jgi:hypothetical protein
MAERVLVPTPSILAAWPTVNTLLGSSINHLKLSIFLTLPAINLLVLVSDWSAVEHSQKKLVFPGHLVYNIYIVKAVANNLDFYLIFQHI